MILSLDKNATNINHFFQTATYNLGSKMKDETLRQIQAIELDIATEVFRLCSKHNLRCSLVGGSAIGAIRHKGFIPWDDDIDLAMPRSDYERFVEICKTELNKSFFLQCFETEENCAFIFAKVRKNGTRLPEYYSEHINMHHGVWVDIFVYDNVSDNPRIRKYEMKLLQFYRNLLIIKIGYKLPKNKRGFVKKIAFSCGKLLTLFFPKNFLQSKCHKIMTRHINERTSCIFPYGGAYSNKKELMPNDFFQELIDAPFEDRVFKITNKYDYYLSNLFGDYMTPPPPENRIPGNHFLDESSIVLN